MFCCDPVKRNASTRSWHEPFLASTHELFQPYSNSAERPELTTRRNSKKVCDHFLKRVNVCLFVLTLLVSYLATGSRTLSTNFGLSCEHSLERNFKSSFSTSVSVVAKRFTRLVGSLEC
jgi:hypothetical protein